MKTNLVNVSLVGAALLLTASPFGMARADSSAIIGFLPPAAQANATNNDVNPPVVTIRHDVSLFNGCNPEDVRYVDVDNSGGHARAQAARDYNHFAMASANTYGATVAEASLWIRNRDPQDRGTVKLNVLTRAYAEAAGEPPPGADTTGASYLLSVGYLSHTLQALVDVDTCTVRSADWVADVMRDPIPLQVYGYDRVWWTIDNELSHAGGIRTFVNGIPRPETPQSASPQALTLEIASNSSVVVAVRASAGNGGAAAVDPIITVHPDNPDVEIEIEAPEGPADRHPFDGITADELASRGIDPQPFINLGFLDGSGSPPPPPPPPPSGDTTPPATSASATPDANTLGWNRTPVTVTLTATDNAGGSGVKEVHIALAGASTGSRVETGSAASVDIVAEGETTLTYFAVDNVGNEEAAKTLTVRIDKTPPSLTGLPAAGCTLWPPDHRLVQVASVNAADNGSGMAGFTLDATSNEPETGTGDGDVGPDVIVTGGVVQLRAERAGNGVGRIYTITARATDRAGNVATQTAKCAVPHDSDLH